jgi:hypothetical protein
MKNLKLYLLIIIAFSLLVQSAHAGLLTLGAKASIYNPPEEGANPSVMYGFVLDYDINRILHARAGASYTSYTAKGINYTLMPITLNLIAHFMPESTVDPYLGGGVGYYSKTVDGVESSKTGGQAIGGITFRLEGFYAGFEVQYIVPDLAQSDIGSLSWGGWASGTSYIWIPF